MNEEYALSEDYPLPDLDAIDIDTDADGDEPTAEALAELAALDESARATDLEVAAQLAEVQRALEDQRALTAAAVARYREATLRAEPDIPPDLVAGDSIEAVDASLEPPAAPSPASAPASPPRPTPRAASPPALPPAATSIRAGLHRARRSRTACR